MKTILISKELVAKTLENLKMEDKVSLEILYRVYFEACSAIDYLKDNKVIATYQIINSSAILNYAIGELLYLSDKKDIKYDETFIAGLVNRVVDKFVTIELFSIKTHGLYSKYSPVISNIMTMISFMLSSLPIIRTKNKNDIRFDILEKVIFLARCIVDLILAGFETEAFSTWRTMHESECILLVLVKTKKEGLDAYLRHMVYSLAFRNAIEDKTKQDNIFIELKEKMKAHDLKSKDMKKFIEYGWLYDAVDSEAIEGFKLNFRNGLEVAAGLSNYAKWYEMSSEIAHSSPLLIFSRKEYFAKASLINLYESFFRVEPVFTNLYVKSVDEASKKRYLEMRNAYMQDIKEIYIEERNKFIASNKAKSHSPS